MSVNENGSLRPDGIFGRSAILRFERIFTTISERKIADYGLGSLRQPAFPIVRQASPG